MPNESDMTPETYYDQYPEREAARLDALPTTRLEFENTCHELEVVLPDAGHILDAGGGPGRYSVWLADHGYTVSHCDISEELVALAKEQVSEHDVRDRVSCRQADLRDLPYQDNQFDGVCCLGGPLSHILDPSDRHTALEELARVAKPESPVLIAVMGRLAAIRDTIKHVLPEEQPPYGLVAALAEDGRYTEDRVGTYRDGDGWAETKFFRTTELETECETAGFTVQRLVGLEGIASNLAPELEDVDEDAMDMVREIVREQRTDPAVVDNSEHILAICQSPHD